MSRVPDFRFAASLPRIRGAQLAFGSVQVSGLPLRCPVFAVPSSPMARFKFQVSGVKWLVTAFRPLSSVPRLLSFVLLLFTLTAFAQDVSSVSEDINGLVSPSSAQAEPVAVTKQTPEKWEQELLRDPFWPVGFFPEDWKKSGQVQGTLDLEGASWKSASEKIRISGTSRLGGRTAAIIDGDLKSIGDQIEVSYEGKTYQWQIIGMDADGRIQLKKLGVR